MDYQNDTLFSRKNKHLNSYERGQIALLANQGNSPYRIAKILQRSLNTILNEIRRGTVPQIRSSKIVHIYFPDSGQRVYEERRKNCGRKFKLLKCEKFIAHVEDQFFNKKFSLDSICGRATKKMLFSPSEMVSTRTLYNYVDQGLLRIINLDLPLKVRRNPKNKRLRKHKRVLGRSIAERPAYIADREEFGHWEIDTVIGRKNKSEPVLVTITERKTRKELIFKIPDRTASSVLLLMERLIIATGDKFSRLFKSITCDNGSEFAEISKIESQSKCLVYFARPYTSGERGTNERHNGLIRRFIPKGKSLADYSESSIMRIQEWCNELPRKILGYLTPQEMFEKELENI